MFWSQCLPLEAEHSKATLISDLFITIYVFFIHQNSFLLSNCCQICLSNFSGSLLPQWTPAPSTFIPPSCSFRGRTSRAGGGALMSGSSSEGAGTTRSGSRPAHETSRLAEGVGGRSLRNQRVSVWEGAELRGAVSQSSGRNEKKRKAETFFSIPATVGGQPLPPAGPLRDEHSNTTGQKEHCHSLLLPGATTTHSARFHEAELLTSGCPLKPVEPPQEVEEKGSAGAARRHRPVIGW